ncbi:MAG: hypothetical protein WCJ42_00660 [Actinomycetes bacterium]
MISSLKTKSARIERHDVVRDRRPLFAVGGAVALVVVGIALYLLFFAGNSTDSNAMLGPVSLPTHGASASAAPAVTVAPVAVVGTRDPFNAVGVIPAVVATPAPTTAAPVAPTPSVSPTNSGTQFVFKLVDLSKTTTTVLVNGHAYTPAVGDQFGTFFRLYAIFGSTCAGFQFGTQNVALCKGDSTVLTQ